MFASEDDVAADSSDEHDDMISSSYDISRGSELKKLKA